MLSRRFRYQQQYRFFISSSILSAPALFLSSALSCPFRFCSQQEQESPSPRRRVRVVVRKIEDTSTSDNNEKSEMSDLSNKSSTTTNTATTTTTSSSGSSAVPKTPAQEETIAKQSVSQLASLSDETLEKLWSTFTPGRADEPTSSSPGKSSSSSSLADPQRQSTVAANYNTEDDDESVLMRLISVDQEEQSSQHRDQRRQSVSYDERQEKQHRRRNKQNRNNNNNNHRGVSGKLEKLSRDISQMTNKLQSQDTSEFAIAKRKISSEMNSRNQQQQQQQGLSMSKSLNWNMVGGTMVNTVTRTLVEKEQPKVTPPTLMNKVASDNLPPPSPSAWSSSPSQSSSSNNVIWPKASSLPSSESSLSSFPPVTMKVKPRIQVDAVDVLLTQIPEQQQRQQQQQQQQEAKRPNFNDDNDDNDDGWSIIPETKSSRSSKRVGDNYDDIVINEQDIFGSSSSHQLNYHRSVFSGRSQLNRTTIIESSFDHPKRNFTSSSSILISSSTFVGFLAPTNILFIRQQELYRRIESIQKEADLDYEQQQQLKKKKLFVQQHQQQKSSGKARPDHVYLGKIVHKIFSELSTDGKRLPISRCISYLFDNKGCDFTSAAVAFADGGKIAEENVINNNSSSSNNKNNTTTSTFTLQQLADFFAPSKPLTFVPASIKKEVRNRFQQNGGLLKFVEQHLHDRFAVSKDPVTSELCITVCVHDAFSSTFGENMRGSENSHNQQQQIDEEQASSGGGGWKPWSSSFGDYADTQKINVGSLGGSLSSSLSAATASSVLMKPWSATHQRMQLELSWTERVPVDKAQVDTFMDMMAAGPRPIYGDEWFYHGGVFYGGGSGVGGSNLHYQNQFFKNHLRQQQHGGGSVIGATIQPRVFRSNEVADFFVEHTPTFWVLERQLARSLADRFPEVLEESGFSRMEDFFDRYPRIFEVYFDGDPRAREVRLNPSFNRNHPKRGACNSVWELRASPRAEDEALQAQDRLFGRILLENLAKQEEHGVGVGGGGGGGSGLYVFLPDWIRKSFSDKDRSIINSAPPQRSLMILNRYANLFQIRSHETDRPPEHQQKRFVNDESYDYASPSQQQQQEKGAESENGAENETQQSSVEHEHQQERVLLSIEDEYSHIPPEFRIWVRRRPTHLAPRCLDEFDIETSPAPVLAKHLFESLTDLEREKKQEETTMTSTKTPTADVAKGNKKDNTAASAGDEDENNNDDDDDGSTLQQLKSEISIQALYGKLNKEHRHMLKPFSSLAKFLRLHGQVFTVSVDLQRVSLHRWDGASQAFATIDSLLAEEERNSPFVPDNNLAFKPRTRKQLEHLDPTNPFLNRAYLQKAIHDVLPEHSAVLVTDLFKRLLPAEAWAALPTRNPYSVLMSTPILSVWKAHVNINHNNNNNNSSGGGGGTGRRCLMVQRGELGPPPKGCGLSDCASKEEVITQIQELLATVHPNGMSIRVLHERLRWDAIVGIREHFKSIDACLKRYPQMFEIEVPAEVGDTIQEVGAFGCVVYLKQQKKH